MVGRFKLESRAMFGIKAFVLIRLKDQDGHTLQVVKARTWVDGRIGTGRKGHVVTFDEEVYDNVRPQIATVELEFVKEE